MNETSGLPAGVRILVVEDEALIADEIADRLGRLGCRIVGIADTAARAIELAERERPDLALMDIRLKGPMDGIEAAERIHARCDVPVVFLTAHSDQATLDRAMGFGPFGYVLKPFKEQELLLALRIALHRGGIERELWASQRGHERILAGIAEGVLAWDSNWRVRYLNARAEALTGWSAADALRQPLDEVLQLRDPSGSPQSVRALALGAEPVRLELHARHGQASTPVEVSVSSLDSKGGTVGGAITLRSLSEQQRAERRFRELLESAPDAMILIDAQRRIRLVNSQAERMFGHPRAGMLGQHIELLMPARFHGRRLPWRKDEGEGHRLRELDPAMDLYGLRADDSEFPVEIRSGPVETEDGRLLCVAVRDVTARRQAEQKLRESEERFRGLTRLSSDWYWEQDAQFRFVTFSGDLTARTGIGAAEHMGKTRWEMPASNVSAAQWAAHRAALEAHEPFRDFIMRRPDTDGRPHWVSISGEPMFDAQGRLTGYRGVGRDITERMLTVQALAESEAQLRFFFERAPAALAVFDTAMRYLAVSHRYLEHNGLTEAAVIGRSHYEIFPDVPKRWRVLHRRALAGEALRCDEDPWLRADGSTHWHRWELLPWQRQDGSPGGIVMFTQDVTAARRAEDEIRRLNTDLERRVAERTAELTAARDEAKRLAQVKGDFLAQMSHEIRTPLHAILGLAGIGARADADADVPALFTRIVAAGDHLLGVINDILDLSKFEAGKVQVERQPFPLEEVVGHARDFVAPAAQRKGLAYRLRLAHGLPRWVAGDALHLQQILVNLLSNAVKFTDSGSVTLDVERDGEQVRFAVSDTGIGIGIDAAQRERLFRPFEQLNQGPARRFGGTGLGLMLSQNLASLMGGRITVDSAPGSGSCFTLWLPLQAVDVPAPSAPEDAAEAGRLDGVRVLAADDDEVNRLILSYHLQRLGAQAEVLDSGLGIVQRLADGGAERWDIVLMDVQMPHMDGYETTRRIQAIAPALPVIGLTAHALPEEMARCLAAGMVDHVTKPFDPATLVAAMHRQLASAHRRA